MAAIGRDLDRYVRENASEILSAMIGRPLGEKDGGGVVYFLCSGNGTAAKAIKIGRATKGTINNRIAVVKCDNCQPVELAVFIPGTAEDERALHRAFRDELIRGEWFRCTDRVALAVRCAYEMMSPEDVRRMINTWDLGDD